ncbi:uncharacterized protein LOC142219426 [Haematobia irritans]|uniref:uncharacterized protein LOC142219426 n=1 Tax=Haematobia irritans TaxID=7368 RepID=UPI003F4F66B9
MKIVSIASLIAILVSSTTAQVSRGVFSDPAHPGKCVIDNLILSPGQEGSVRGQCELIMCNNENGLATMHGCGAMHIQGCELGDSLYPNELYPKCCERQVICPEGLY